MSYLSNCCGSKPLGRTKCSCCGKEARFTNWQEGADPEMTHWEDLATWNERFSGD